MIFIIKRFNSPFFLFLKLLYDSQANIIVQFFVADLTII